MKHVFLIIGILTLLLLVACAPETTEVPSETPDLPVDEQEAPGTPPFPPETPGQDSGTVLAGTSEEQCETFGGTYLAEHNECEGISENACTELGGTFNPCASACRHNPDAEVCTMQCVLVCQLP